MGSYQDWIGKTKTIEDRISSGQARLMANTMAVSNQSHTIEADIFAKPGAHLPHGWHWIYFLEGEPGYSLGRDGHSARGRFLPPVELPRRMWAGSRIKFHKPIIIGDQVSKTTTIVDVAEKTGKSGELCFVTLEHRYIRDGVLLLSEQQDLVYRQDPEEGEIVPKAKGAPKDPQITSVIEPDPVWLFRYSALTFNGHRIHYDVDYARDVEGYSGLIFHGPLTATLLLGLATEIAGEDPISTFQFRGVSPIFDTGSFTINARKDGKSIKLWATTQTGDLAVSAEAETV